MNQMAVIVTLDMYSGRPNPSWELNESQVQEFLKLLQTKRRSTQLKSTPSWSRLGYRGFVITMVAEAADLPKGMRVFDGIVEHTTEMARNYIDHNSEIEQFLINTAGTALSKETKDYVQQEMEKNVKSGTARSLADIIPEAVPPYNPVKWNNDPFIMANNNCYNYGNDKITNTFAQPGRGSGQEGPHPPNCQGTGSAAERDGQLVVPNPDLTPAEGHIIALVISPTPGFLDYHWYRRDVDTMWSHKPGSWPATNQDNSGQLISDPRACDRGPYTSFCGFYHCVPAQTRIL
jgi:hypothetical protein